ncbi:MAG: choice-of-anchor D domain-containing protein [Wenzhouxiangella sp.]
MKVKNIIGASSGLLLLAVASAASAQTFTVQDATAREGSEQVTVDWSLTGGSAMTAAGVDITFDSSLISPVLGEGIAVANCIANNGGAQLEACNLVGDGDRIRISLQNFTTPLTTASGTITFNIDAGALEGDSTDLTLTVPSVVPTTVVIQLVEGSVSIVGTDAELTLTPASFEFETVDILDPAQSTTFTIGNAGEEDSLRITSISVGGAPFAISPNCVGDLLAPGATCPLTVTFDPTAPGDFTATLTVVSDAGTQTAALTGAATAEGRIVINPPFGPVNLGAGSAGQVLTANGNVQNTGSADVTVQCDLIDTTGGIAGAAPMAVFSTTLPLGSPVTLVAGADAIDFSVSCALPADAEDGSVFTGEIQCGVDGEPATPATTHFLTCSVSEFNPIPVPTMQSWGLILFALMMLLVGGITIRFFRA